MARQKQATPVKRGTHNSTGFIQKTTAATADDDDDRYRPGQWQQTHDDRVGGRAAEKRVRGGGINVKDVVSSKPASLVELLVCIGGIYASFLSWAVLQERITTTTYGPASSPEVFRYSIFLNTVQSTFAALLGYVYLFMTTFSSSGLPRVLPTWNALPALGLVAVTSSLASPFGYASLKHIDYITFILAKSCKLLPVMALHLTVFRKRYPLYKYAVVALVTAGVAVFTLQHPSTIDKRRWSKGDDEAQSLRKRNQAWGLFLLGINLLLDGLTNSTQDFIFQTFRPFSGPQMMCVQNVLNTALTVSYLFGGPYLARLRLVRWLAVDLGGVVGTAVSSTAGAGEFNEAMAFLRRHPALFKDVVFFAICGAVGQIFIFYTLAHFSSLLLVTVTVTRKMLTMMLSVVWFGHRLSSSQWFGVALVFTGVGAEGYMQKREKDVRAKEKETLSRAAPKKSL